MAPPAAKGPTTESRTGVSHFNPAAAVPPAASSVATTPGAPPAAASVSTVVEAGMLPSKWLLGLGLAAAAGGAFYFFRKK